MKKVIKHIKVVLLQNVPHLGQAGEIKEVKPGFARNFLIPQNLACFLTDPRAQMLKEKKSSAKKEITQEKDKMAQKIQALDGKEFSFSVKVNQKGRPFQSIKAKEIAQKLALPEELILTEPIKEIGRHQILIKDNPQIKVFLEVLPEK